MNELKIAQYPFAIGQPDVVRNIIPMGNICVDQVAQGPEMASSIVAVLEQNLIKYKKDAPLKEYATKSNQRPVLSSKIEQVIRKETTQKCNQFLSEEFEAQDNLQGNSLPTFFINSKQVYYQGQWIDHLPHGSGKVYFDNGSYFQGSFMQGEAYGKDCLLIFSDGSYYRGEVQNSKLEGRKGRFQSATVIYTGQWRNNKPEGRGIQNFADGSQYDGQFKEGLKQGKGSFRWNDNRVYQGQFQKGYMHGQGKFFKGQTEKYEGTFNKNKKQGVGKLITAFGQYQGPFVDGQLSGEGKFKWNDKKVYEGSFLNSKLHGKGRLIFQNGQMVEGVWKDGINIQVTDFFKKKSKS